MEVSPRGRISGQRSSGAPDRATLAAPQSVVTASGVSTATSRPRRMHEIDGLRALAVTLIVFHHSVTSALVGSPRQRSGGSLLSAATTSGVELFFVLSGVLLLRPYFRDRRPFAPIPYLRRRIERLWPPYLAALGFAGLVTLLVTLWPSWYSAEVLPRFSMTDWLAQAGILNFGWTAYSGAWWSLTIEVLFYLCVPIVVVAFVWCNSRVRMVFAIGLIALAIPLLIANANPYSPDVIDVAAMFAPCFVMGAFLARYSPGRSAGVTMLGGGFIYVLVANWWPVIDIHLGFALLYSGLLILSMSPRTAMNRVLSKPLPVWLGERSYSLFLVHFPVFYLANWFASMLFPSRTVGYFFFTRAIGLPLALFVAMVIFWSVERRYARGLATAGSFWPSARLST